MAPQLSWIEQLPSKQQVVRSNRTGVAISMKKFYFIIINLLIVFEISANDFRLVCNEISKSSDKSFSQQFVKIINFEDRTLLNYSGNYFDKVVMFNKKEVIIHNKIFDITSTFNIKDKRWISYKGQFIKIYNCKQKKRRF